MWVAWSWVKPLPEMPSGEGVAGAFLEVLLEGQSLVLVLEVDGYDQFPGAPMRSVGRGAGVVFGDALLQVFSGSDVALSRESLGLEEVDVHQMNPAGLALLRSWHSHCEP